MITLRKNSDRRVRRGHLWVFSNEIADPPVSQLEIGSIHELRDAAGKFLGIVYVNPFSLITARIISRKKISIDESFFFERIKKAYETRRRFCFDKEAYRLVYGESDLLPGLVVDKYGRFAVVQSLTAGMDNLLDMVLQALVEIISPEGIYLRNDSPMRALEGLSLEKRTAYGSIPEKVIISSLDLKFFVDIVNGQKTGFFLDQEFNRHAVRRYIGKGVKVLDAFSYTGAWGLHAAAEGAGEVIAVDSSQGALDMAVENAKLNGFSDRFTPVRDSVTDFLKKNGSTWDVMFLDPPAFIKSRAQIREGIKGYIDINKKAVSKLNSDGILVTCSCSHHLDYASFKELLHTATTKAGKDLRLLETRGQGPDHPVLLAMPETRYLKTIIAQVVQNIRS